jgi:hypothetical protein
VEILLAWENKIIICIKELGVEGVNWIHLAQDEDQWRALPNTVEYVEDP